MPLFEFQCENCGQVFEALLHHGEDYPPCPHCASPEVLKLPSVFAYQNKALRREERERAILKRASDYLKDGKLKDAKNFLQKAVALHPTDKIKRLSENLERKRPPKGGFLIKPEAIITKKKGGAYGS